MASGPSRSILPLPEFSTNSGADAVTSHSGGNPHALQHESPQILQNQYPTLHERLRQERTLLATLDRLAIELKNAQVAWMTELHRASSDRDFGQIASAGLELAIEHIQGDLPPVDGVKLCYLFFWLGGRHTLSVVPACRACGNRLIGHAHFRTGHAREHLQHHDLRLDCLA
jgi:hypothetical protein